MYTSDPTNEPCTLNLKFTRSRASLNNHNALNCMFWNIQGLSDKLDYEHTQKEFSKFDIIMICETWAGKSRDTKDITLNGYQTMNFPRPTKHRKARRDLHRNICAAFKWEKEKLDKMKTHLTDIEAWKYFELYLTQMLENNSPNSVAEAFFNYILQAARKTLTRKKMSKGKRTFPSNKWYDSECREMRAKLCEMRSISTGEWDDETKANHKRYRNITQKKKRAYKQEIVGELVN